MLDTQTQTGTEDRDITYYAKKRYTAKAYDREKKISPENISKVKELLRFSPSSTNAQPWHFILASSEEGKDRIANSTDDLYPFNSPSIRNASHVVVFASRLAIEEDFLLRVLQQEDRDGRFAADPSFKMKMHGGRKMFVNLHKQDYKDVQHWIDKQVYLNIGQFLLGVATLGIDATPMEGIDVKVLDEELGLREKGYSSLVVVTLGYHDPEEDYNANLPKSRLPYAEILTEV
ncbi:oxygen-insensitive NAD(P)H nitroreductase [Mariniblastus fucicola]|uniref:Oxygen-insensitive NAD(P)H nitroreductase n=1 Tax=Mariniblastus fucicola TaxID=980251 RepID=A0A5B9PAX3_9BACT|nr:oxygen-insensitive NAD(P)H nitroreductase [Mariniblastus fucicola]QEG22659.1 Oxygen-insensitive NAD(P)H nitroreductase [Mariniblastus fucicola]